MPEKAAITAAAAVLIQKTWRAGRQNKKDFREIREHVASIETSMKLLKEKQAEAMEHPTMSDRVKSMEESLKRAIKVVNECQGTNRLVRRVSAIIMSKKLREVQKDISNELLLLNQAQTAVHAHMHRHQQDAEYHGSFGENYGLENMNMDFALVESIICGNKSPSHLKLPFLEFITNGFSEKLRIGNGGCGVVYKGILRNQIIIAVKRLLNSQTIDDKMFHQEVTSLMMVNHKNVVQFLGFCSHTEEQAFKIEGKPIMAEDRKRLLCFEYLINGSLESHLTDELRGLEWETRYQIIRGICDGLHHLHSENHIIHMDLKPANILLDSNMVPKITDFGLSRFDNISKTMSLERLGSRGYCAPEYQDHGKMSAKSDIYSLGVIILELVTGSRQEPNITNVHRRWKHRWNKAAVDVQLGYKQVATCLDLVGRCMQRNPIHRPDIHDIISQLNELDSSDVETSECIELEDMLGIEPLEIHLPIELNKQISCSVELINETDDYFAFRISTTSLHPYHIEANQGTVPPRSKRRVTISMEALDKALPGYPCRDEFFVQSTRLDRAVVAMDTLVGHIFHEEQGKVIDNVSFSVVHSEAAPNSSDQYE